MTTNIKHRLGRIEKRLKPKQNWRWYQNCHPLVMLHIFLGDYGIELSNSEFSKLTGLSGLPYTGEENDEVERWFIDNAIKFAETSDVTVEQALQMFDSIDDDAEILHPVNVKPPRTERKLRKLPLVGGGHLSDLDTVFFWYCCCCWYWQQQKKEYREKMNFVKVGAHSDEITNQTQENRATSKAEDDSEKGGAGFFLPESGLCDAEGKPFPDGTEFNKPLVILPLKDEDSPEDDLPEDDLPEDEAMPEVSPIVDKSQSDDSESSFDSPEDDLPKRRELSQDELAERHKALAKIHNDIRNIPPNLIQSIKGD